MKNQFHTVLGANGAIGNAVIEELQKRNLLVKAVTRTSKSEKLAVQNANLLNEEATLNCIKGSSYVYLCIGLPYKTKIWKSDWEIIMKNVITACAEHNAKLIFLDNIYMYKSPLPNNFDEQTLQEPISEKGKARKRTTDLMMEAIKKEEIVGLIGRSADFYGKKAINSSLYVSFLERMLANKNPQLLTNTNIKHTYSYTTDIGKALVQLALTEDCYGQVWHLPVNNPITIDEIITIHNKILGKNLKASILPIFMKKILSLFIPEIKEVNEMLYQFENEYIMSWEKFKNRFPDFQTTNYETSFLETVDWFKRNKS